MKKGIAVFLLFSALFLSCALFAEDFGSVKGRTLFFVKGYPGALIGKPEPNWKAPAPRPVPNETIYWLKLAGDKAEKLFTSTSDADAFYEVKLPPGRYRVECASKWRWKLDRLGERARDERALIEALFPVSVDAAGTMIITGPADLEIKTGEAIEYDLEAGVLYVD